MIRAAYIDILGYGIYSCMIVASSIITLPVTELITVYCLDLNVFSIGISFVIVNGIILIGLIAFQYKLGLILTYETGSLNIWNIIRFLKAGFPLLTGGFIILIPVQITAICARTLGEYMNFIYVIANSFVGIISAIISGFYYSSSSVLMISVASLNVNQLKRFMVYYIINGLYIAIVVMIFLVLLGQSGVSLLIQEKDKSLVKDILIIVYLFMPKTILISIGVLLVCVFNCLMLSSFLFKFLCLQSMLNLTILIVFLNFGTRTITDFLFIETITLPLSIVSMSIYFFQKLDRRWLVEIKNNSMNNEGQ